MGILELKGWRHYSEHWHTTNPPKLCSVHILVALVPSPPLPQGMAGRVVQPDGLQPLPPTVPFSHKMRGTN